MSSATTKSERFDSRLWEAELLRVNRALRLVSETNKSLNYVDDVVTWLNQVCQTAVNVGGFRMACVEFADQDEQKTIRVVATAGFEAGYFKTFTLTWADEPHGRGPAGIAIRTGKPCIARNIPIDPSFAPWREQSTRRGYQSAVAVPLTCDGRTFGVLGLYADVVDAFGPREVQVLEELAGDLAFGLTVVLRTRAERHAANDALIQSQRKQRQAAEALEGASRSLEAKNVALREVLASIDAEQDRIGRQIAANVQKIILPLVHSLKQTSSRPLQRRLEQIERALDEVASPFVDKVSRAVGSLTPMELRICTFVRRGLAVKEIAELEGLSPQTIAAHRRNIRRKLAIAHRKINLTSHLQRLFEEFPE